MAADEDPTNLPSWLGVANPASPFNNELGNRIAFIAVVHDSSSTVDIATGLNFLFTVPSGSDYDTGGGVALTAARTTYSAFTVGVDVDGSNNVTNTLTSGAGAHNFIVSFVGFGLEPFESPEDQTAINDNLAAIRSTIADKTITDCTTFGNGGGCGATNTATVFDVGAVPELSTTALFAIGVVGLGLLRRKLRS